MLNSPVSRRSQPSIGRPRLSGVNDNQRLRIVPPSGRGALGRVPSINRYLGAVGLALTALNYLQNFKPESWENLGDWSLYCETPSILIDPTYNGGYGRGSPTSVVNNSVIFNNVTAGTKGQATDYVGDPWAGVFTNHRSVALGRTKVVGSSYRMQYQQGFTRPNQGAFVKPVLAPAKLVIALPSNPPITKHVTENPMNAKPGEAPAFTRPIPWEALPNTAPSTGREASYGEPDLYPVPSVPFYPAKVPNDWSISIQDAPAGVGAASAPKTHTMRPPRGKPPKNEKEVKHKLPTAAVALLKAVSAVTEAVDFVDALYKALPAEFRPKYRNTKHEKKVTTPLERMEAVYKNAEKIDIYNAIDNLVENQIEDYAFGKLGQAGGEVSKRLGSGYGMGVNTINRKLQKSWYAAGSGPKVSVYGG